MWAYVPNGGYYTHMRAFPHENNYFSAPLTSIYSIQQPPIYSYSRPVTVQTFGLAPVYQASAALSERPVSPQAGSFPKFQSKEHCSVIEQLAWRTSMEWTFLPSMTTPGAAMRRHMFPNRWLT